MHRISILMILLLVGCATHRAPENKTPDGPETAAAAEGHGEESAVDATIRLPNLKTPVEGLFLGGQPDPDALRAAVSAGVRTVINLRGADEMTFDEAALLAGLGVRYVHIPVAGAGGVSFEAARTLRQALDAAESSTLVHCASGNRVGALFALDAAQSNGADVEAAIELGKAYGMTGLEGRVRELLEAAAN